MSDRTPSNLPASNAINDSSSQQMPVLTGAVLPSDMRIKLIRADSSAFDMILTALFSITLTLSGIFLGAWITNATKPSALEELSTVSFGLLSLALIAWWIVIKVCQMKKGVTIPLSLIESIKHNGSQTKVVEDIDTLVS